MKVRPYLWKKSKKRQKTPKNTLFTSLDPRSRYKNDTVFPILTEGRMEAYHRHQDLRSLFNYFYGWVQNYQSVSSDPRTHSGHHQTSDSTQGITEKVATY